MPHEVFRRTTLFSTAWRFDSIVLKTSCDTTCTNTCNLQWGYKKREAGIYSTLLRFIFWSSEVGRQCNFNIITTRIPRTPNGKHSAFLSLDVHQPVWALRFAVYEISELICPRSCSKIVQGSSFIERVLKAGQLDDHAYCTFDVYSR